MLVDVAKEMQTDFRQMPMRNATMPRDDGRRKDRTWEKVVTTMSGGRCRKSLWT
ncbi:MAG: hypothetical protein PUK42_07600 [Prevotellaceae bacterium]|nr:hypothetical protein [Prevotellaceae bacterium]